MGESVEQGEQVTELVSAYDDVALAGMVLELRGRVRLLEQRVDDLSTAEQREKELREALREVRARIHELCAAGFDSTRGQIGVKAQRFIDDALVAQEEKSGA